MTENKRFTITQDFEEHHRQIRDNGYILMGCFVEPQAEVIVDLLNQLNDENEELKQRLSDLQKENYGNIDGIAFYQEENASLCEKISDLECENEELKQQLADIDRLIDDLGNNEMQRQYEEIMKEEGEND